VQKRDLACFLVVVLAALFWRVCGLTFDSLWLDEGYQTVVDAYGRGQPNFLQVPAQPFLFKPTAPAAPSEMLRNFRSVDPLTPPLYQLLLNRWIVAFGGSDAALRSLSVVFSTAAVGATFVFVNMLLGWRVAFLAGLLQAFSPFDVYYGQEVRMYALEELCAIVSCGALLMYLFGSARAKTKPVAWRPPPAVARCAWLVLHAVAVWALINSHYTGLFLFAFEIALGCCVAMARGSWKTLGELVAAWVLVGLLWVPWLGLFLQAAHLRTASFYVARKPSLLWPFTALFGRIPANWVVFMSGKQVWGAALPIYATSAVILLLALIILFAPHLVARFGLDKTRMDERRVRIIMVCILGWALIPAMLLWFIDVIENHRVIEISRYLVATAPSVFVLAGWALSRLNWRSKLFAGLLGAQLLFSGINNFAHATVNHQREPWREMAALVETAVKPDQLLLVSQYYDIFCLDRYMHRPYRQVGVSSATTTAQLEEILTSTPRFALVTAQEGDRIVAAVPPRYYAVQHWDLGHSLHLWIYALRS
jgi:uncharacterized membrane protein